MTIGEQLIAHLTADTTITSIVDDRVHQNHMPQLSSYPAIWLSRSGELSHLTFTGAGRIGTNFDLECDDLDGERFDGRGSIFDALA